MTQPRPRVAVVGSGVAGLTAAWVLQRHADVTLYEADDRLGGHAHTRDVVRGSGDSVALDSGFLVHNQRTYPTLLRLFTELGVATQESEMSMSIRCDGCGLEYAGGRGFSGLFAHPGSAVRGRYLRLLSEVRKFHRQARALVDEDQTLGEFLRGFTPYFKAHFVTPLVSAVWSCAPETADAYPAHYLFTFLRNHGMLSVKGSPVWRTVTGGSRTYVEKVAKELTSVRTGTSVSALRRFADRVEIDGEVFDGAVVATHPDQALRLLKNPTRAETRVLGAFGYSRNPTLLHTDTSVLPRGDRARASWNYRMTSCRTAADRVLVSYDLNRLQKLPGLQTYVVTLNDHSDIDPAKVIERMTYEHPIYTPESVAAQRRLPELNSGVLAFAGAYHGWGFHEDGCRSGLRAAESLGGSW